MLYTSSCHKAEPSSDSKSWSLQGLALAIHALHEFNIRAEARSRPAAHLVMAGGYDKRLAENVEHFEEISRLIDELGMAHHVNSH